MEVGRAGRVREGSVEEGVYAGGGTWGFWEGVAEAALRELRVSRRILRWAW